MTFKESILTCIQYKYCDFKGRASRSEYWYFLLFVILVSIVASMIDRIIFGNNQSILYLLVSLGLMLPNLGVAVRRLHDIGKSGWWVLLCLIPVIGLVLIYFFAKAGDSVSNEYGEPPVN